MSIGGHQRAYRGRSDEWFTPPSIIDALGVFDLDPCSTENRPYDTAIKHFTIKDDGLSAKWNGVVWLNPPYGPETSKWLAKLSEHNNGIALIFARTETKMFFDYVWNDATAILFLRSRLYFHHVDGTRAKSNSGAPSILIAYGSKCTTRLYQSGLDGKLIVLKGVLADHIE